MTVIIESLHLLGRTCYVLTSLSKHADVTFLLYLTNKSVKWDVSCFKTGSEIVFNISSPLWTQGCNIAVILLCSREMLNHTFFFLFLLDQMTSYSEVIPLTEHRKSWILSMCALSNSVDLSHFCLATLN